jgi:hypothetical protein
MKARKRILLSSLSLFFLGMVSDGRAELDLSPQPQQFDMEGVKMPQLAFANGEKERVTYQPPANWKYMGSKEGLDLLPEEAAQARAKVTKWSSEAEVSFDEENCKVLTKGVLALLPEGSEQIRVESEEHNPLQIDGKQTYVVEVSYTYYGAKFRGYFLLLQRKPEALSFRLICRAADYDKLRVEFQRSLCSWQNL